MLVPKIVTILMALLYLSGFVWFPGDSISTVDVLVIITVFCAFFVVFFPAKKIQSHMVAYSLIGVVATGICALIAIMVVDLMRPHGSDYIGRTLDFVFIVSFTYMGRHIYTTGRSRGQTR